MHTNSTLRRWLSVGGTLAVLAAILTVVACQRNQTVINEDRIEEKEKAAKDKDGKSDDKKDAAHAWTVWGGTVQRNLVNTFEKNIADDWDDTAEKQKNIKWVVNLGSKAYGGPIISGGKIFIGTNNNRPRDKNIKGDKGVVMCFRESDGEFLWQVVHDKLPDGRVKDWPEEGICSSAVVDGKRMWYVSNRCEVVCAATADGKPEWKLDMIKELGVFPHNLATCSPLIVGDTIFVITSNGVDEGHINIPKPDAPSFLAVDKNKGKVLWSSKAPGKKIMHGQWSNPVYAVADQKPQIIFPGGDGYIYSFNPKDGELNWKFSCNPKAAVYALGEEGTRNDFVSTPIVADNKLYIGVGQDPEHKKGVGHLWCIDITKKPKNKDKDVSAVSTDETDEAANTFDPKDPKNKDSALVWHYGGRSVDGDSREGYRFGRTMSTCSVYDGLCFAADFDGFVYCFDAKTGKRHWEHDMGGADTWSSPTVIDGKVYLGNENREIHVFEASKGKDGKAKLIRKIKMQGKIRSTPVACNGVLYVMTENPCKLHAIKAK